MGVRSRASEIEARVGSVIDGKYALLRVLGTGGMGAVYEAEHTLLKRRVAVKLMLGEPGAADLEAVARFLREAQAAARVVHPHIVGVLDVGHDPGDGTAYLVQELLVGQDLRRRVASGRTLAPREALEALVPVMSALVAAHQRGVIHRDIKPENIFLCDPPADDGDGDGDDDAAGARPPVPKLIDFGVSKVLDAGHGSLALTRSGAVVGTPSYLSPEQARGERTVGVQADIWAVGAVLFEALAGRCPFVAENYNALIVQIASAPPPPLASLAPAVPAALCAVVDGALARDSAARYPTMRAFLAATLACAPLRDEPWMQRLAAEYGADAVERAAPPARRAAPDAPPPTTTTSAATAPGAAEARDAGAGTLPATRAGDADVDEPTAAPAAASLAATQRARRESDPVARKATPMVWSGAHDTPRARAPRWARLLAGVAVVLGAVAAVGLWRARTTRRAAATASLTAPPTTTSALARTPGVAPSRAVPVPPAPPPGVPGTPAPSAPAARVAVRTAAAPGRATERVAPARPNALRDRGTRPTTAGPTPTTPATPPHDTPDAGRPRGPWMTDFERPQ